MRRLLLLLAPLLVACPIVEEPLPEDVRPRLIVRPEHRDEILDRIDAEPWATVYARLVERAERETRLREDPDVWHHDVAGTNCTTAQDAAFLAWLHDDAARGDRARELLLGLQTDFRSQLTWDVNIRMPGSLITCTNAHDLLLGAGMITEEEAADAEARITSVTSQFYEDYVEQDLMRNLLLGPAQNNHPIRTATAIGYVAQAFPDHWQAEQWGDWAFSELDYLWSPEGKYIQADGGVSEEPFYFGFAWAPSVATFIALHNLGPLARLDFERSCISRNDADPWTGHGCVEGEPFTFDNPLDDPFWHSSMEWSMAIRLPWGSRPPKGDAYFNSPPGQGLVAAFGGPRTLVWDWLDNRDEPYETSHGQDLMPHHLAYIDVDGTEAPPEWTSRFMPDAGDMIYRSSWEHDAVWGLLIGEHGAARKTLHDHVDGTSFSVAAYGEYLLVDPGYYKPTDTDNARTAHSPSHNLVLIDGIAAPNKGLLTDFGDADAFLENHLEVEGLVYAEAHQEYQGSRVERSVVMVDGRWFLMADRITTTGAAEREHAWRMGGYAGYEAGGAFTLRDDGARWERDLAGVDVWVSATGGDVVVSEPPKEDWQAPHVHEFEHDRQERHHTPIDGVVQGIAPDFLGVVVPYRVGGPEEPGTVEAVDVAPTARGWKITVDDTVCYAALRPPGPAEELDFGEVWIHTDGELVLWCPVAGTMLMARGTEMGTSSGGGLNTSEPVAAFE